MTSATNFEPSKFIFQSSIVFSAMAAPRATSPPLQNQAPLWGMAEDSTAPVAWSSPRRASQGSTQLVACSWRWRVAESAFDKCRLSQSRDILSMLVSRRIERWKYKVDSEIRYMDLMSSRYTAMLSGYGGWNLSLDWCCLRYIIDIITYANVAWPANFIIKLPNYYHICRKHCRRLSKIC